MSMFESISAKGNTCSGGDDGMSILSHLVMMTIIVTRNFNVVYLYI